MKFKKKVLKNGMRIITVPMKDSPAVTALVMVEAGSKYENKENNGLSHFLEHMCFKGTKKRPNAIDISRELDSIGSQYNAFTSQEYTGYYVKCHPQYTSKIIDVLSDMYMNPNFDQKEIDKEKGVIVEEINMYEDMPHRQVWDLFMELLYGDTPAGWNIAGTRENVKRMTRDDFVKYRNEHYVPSATTVVVAGSINEKKIVKEIEKAFAGMVTSKKYTKLKVKEEQKEPKLLVKNKNTDQTHLILGVRSYDIFDKRIPALKVLGTVLGGGMSSRLFQKLRDQMGVGYYVRASTDEYTDHGYLDVSTGVDKNRVIEVVQAILDEFRKLKTEIVPKHELDKAKDYLVGNMYLDLETSDALTSLYGSQETLKHTLASPKEIEAKIRKVTAKDVQKIAQDIFVNKSLNLAVIGNITDEAPLKSVLKI